MEVNYLTIPNKTVVLLLMENADKVFAKHWVSADWEVICMFKKNELVQVHGSIPFPLAS